MNRKKYILNTKFQRQEHPCKNVPCCTIVPNSSTTINASSGRYNQRIQYFINQNCNTNDVKIAVI